MFLHRSLESGLDWACGKGIRRSSLLGLSRELLASYIAQHNKECYQELWILHHSSGWLALGDGVTWPEGQSEDIPFPGQPSGPCYFTPSPSKYQFLPASHAYYVFFSFFFVTLHKSILSNSRQVQLWLICHGENNIKQRRAGETNNPVQSLPLIDWWKEN